MTDQSTPAISFRLRHTMLPVGDLERSVDFYCRLLGMRVVRRRSGSSAGGGHPTAYVGYGEEASSTVLELVSGTGRQDQPWAGHLAFAVSDMRGLCGQLEQEGIRFVRPLRVDQNGTGRLSAIILDPDGFEVELTSS